MNQEASVERRSSRLHPSIVLSAYLEPLIHGRRVAILGDATAGLADELGERGARLLHVYDPDSARVAEALARIAPGVANQVSYATLAGDLAVRDGAFDVVIVPDLTLFTDPADVMRRARRLVPPTGVAVFVVPNVRGEARRLVDHVAPGAPISRALSYYELFDLVSLQFAKVRMIGQAPFVGYTIADFAPQGEPEVSVDTSLVAVSEEPEHFIAVASDRPVTLDAYAVVALPWEEVAANGGPDPAALTEAEGRVAALGAEIEQLQAREAKLGAVAAREAEQRASADTRAAELQAEIARRDARLRESDVRAGDNHVRAERLTSQVRDLEEELVRQRDRGTKLSKLLDEEKRSRTKAEVELGMVRNKPEIAGSKDRIDALTAELDAARARVAELELEQTETRRRPAVAATPDAKTLHRIDELQHAVNDALGEAAEAAAQREAAQVATRKAEAKLAAVQQRAEEATRRLAEMEARGPDIEARLAERDARLAALEAELAAANAKAKEASDAAEAKGQAEAAASELAALEAALRERGRVITALTRDLRESERVGKELVGELEAGGWGALADTTGAGTGGSGGDLRDRLDSLALSAARAEADLQAAAWRITQLERELADARGTTTDPSAVQLELEQALAAARDEVAALRRALGGSAGAS